MTVSAPLVDLGNSVTSDNFERGPSGFLVLARRRHEWPEAASLKFFRWQEAEGHNRNPKHAASASMTAGSTAINNGSHKYHWIGRQGKWESFSWMASVKFGFEVRHLHRTDVEVSFGRRYEDVDMLSVNQRNYFENFHCNYLKITYEFIEHDVFSCETGLTKKNRNASWVSPCTKTFLTTLVCRQQASCVWHWWRLASGSLEGVCNCSKRVLRGSCVRE